MTTLTLLLCTSMPNRMRMHTHTHAHKNDDSICKVTHQSNSRMITLTCLLCYSTRALKHTYLHARTHTHTSTNTRVPSWPSPSANCQNQTSEKKTFEASLLIMCLAYACGPSNASAHMWPFRHACGLKGLPVCVAIMPADITHALDRPSPTPAPGPPLSAETLSEA